MDKAKQSVTGTKVGGKLVQTSTTPSSEQVVRDSEVGGTVKQALKGEVTTLQVGRYKAAGKIAVILLGIAIIVFVVLKFGAHLF